jgi:RNA 2',3'-cyclic 3'-phosphodiesterase
VRLFAAVAPPEAVLREAAGWVAALAADPATGRGVRWARGEGLHLTLHFFGEVPEAARPRADAALAAAARQAAGPFEVALEGLGAFPSPARARVIWVGVAEPGAARLTRLQAAVARAVAAEGFPVESRPFHPHLTLGRVEASPPAGLARAVAEGAGRRLGVFAVEAVTLYRSVLAPGGARYTALAKWQL